MENCKKDWEKSTRGGMETLVSFSSLPPPPSEQKKKAKFCYLGVNFGISSNPSSQDTFHSWIPYKNLVLPLGPLGGNRFSKFHHTLIFVFPLKGVFCWSNNNNNNNLYNNFQFSYITTTVDWIDRNRPMHFLQLYKWYQEVLQTIY